MLCFLLAHPLELFYGVIGVGVLFFLAEFFLCRASFHRPLLFMSCLLIGTIGLACNGRFGMLIFSGLFIGLTFLGSFIEDLDAKRRQQRELRALMLKYGIDISGCSVSEARQKTELLEPIDEKVSAFLQAAKVPVIEWQNYTAVVCQHAIHTGLVQSIEELEELLEKSASSSRTNSRL